MLAVGAAALAGTGLSPAAAEDTTDLPPFSATIETVTAERLGASWREGCPVGPDALRLIRMTVLGIDGQAYLGELIVAAAVAQDVADTFGELYANGYPIERMVTVEQYGADDDLSMAANNTSAFNCRPITGGTAWSNHSYGRAIDINPVQNPYLTKKNGTVYPPNGAPYVDRTLTDPRMIHDDDATVRAFEERGWQWGGYWKKPIDYQHFEQPLS